MSQPSEPPPETRQGALWAIERGNTLRAEGELENALQAYDRAVALLTPWCDDEKSPLRDDLASAWTNQGIALFNQDDPARLAEIVAAFDRAVALRATLQSSLSPGYQYNLAGVWLNRGDALMRFGGPPASEEALRSYVQAEQVGRGLERAGPPEFVRRVALIHLNLAFSHLGSGAPDPLDPAARSFRTAAETLALLGSARTPVDLAMAATAWVGHAETAERAGNAEEARRSADRALDLVRGVEEDHRRAAVAGLRARWILCSLAERDAARDLPAAASAQAAATDAAEEGIRLALRWDEQGAFQPFVLQFFHYGLKAYGGRQPHFLAEFIAEHLPLAKPGSAAEARRLAAQAVAFTLGRIADRGAESVRPVDAEKTLATFRELRELQAKLAAAEA